MKLSRRQALGAAAAAPAALAMPQIVRAQSAETEQEVPMIAPYRSVNVGDFKVTTLLAGNRPMENPHGTFGLNASDEDFAAAAKANFRRTLSSNRNKSSKIRSGKKVRRKTRLC